MAAHLLRWGDRANAYFAVGTFRKGGRRTNDDARAFSVLWADLDVGHLKPYATIDSALLALRAFPLHPVAIIRSGGGLHVYWLLDEVSRGADDLAKHRRFLYGLADRLQGDLAACLHSQILRLPGTYNHKHAPPHPVLIERLDHDAPRHGFLDFEDAGVVPRDPGADTRRRHDAPQQWDGPPPKVQRIASGCTFVAHCRDDAATLTEPEWYAALGIAARCEDGHEVSHEWSKPHPGYSKKETDRKIGHALGDAGPATCRYVEDRLGWDGCGACKFRGKITSPIVLGNFVNASRPDDETAPSAGSAAPPDDSDICTFPQTDSGNGELFARLYGDQLRYDWTRRRWLEWRGHWWGPDSVGRAGQLAKDAARTRYRAAESLGDPDRRKAAARWAITSESAAKITACLERAASERPLADSGTSWDADPWLLGVENGVIDLRTGKLRDGRPADRITRSIPIAFDGAASCPRWRQFLAEVFSGEPELPGFIQRAIGYILTGSTREQALFLLQGGGANGKSTLLNVLRNMLGDYAGNVPFSTLELRSRNAGGFDLAPLAGQRLVTSSETNEGTRLNASRVKALTGGDPITAAFKFADAFTFVPVAKFWLAVNHLPIIDDDSDGMWRRIRLISFKRQFTGADRDDRLEDTLHAELPGIPPWAVEGCLAWQRDGLGAPDSVMLATWEYRQEADHVNEFLNSGTLTFAPGLVATSADIYRAYKQFADSHGEKAVGQRVISARLRDRGCSPTKIPNGGGRGWSGVSAPESAAQDHFRTDGTDGTTKTRSFSNHFSRKELLETSVPSVLSVPDGESDSLRDSRSPGVATRWPCVCDGCEYCQPDGVERVSHRTLDLVGRDRISGKRCVGCEGRAS